MKAMIFAAGLGTRLRPLTEKIPKALVEVNGKPLLQIVIERLKLAGCQEAIVNVHHFAEQIIGFLENNNYFGIRIAISDESEKLLETGGGLKKAAWFFDDGQPFLVCNVDVLTNLDLVKFYQHHLRNKALATLAVRSRTTSRSFLLDEHMHLVGWENKKTGEQRLAVPIAACTVPFKPYAFSGIHVISTDLFKWMPAEEKFSIVDVYLKAAENTLIEGYLHDEDVWLDVGKPDSLAAAEKMAW